MTYRVVSYIDVKGHEKAAEWINDPRNANIKASIRARITHLEKHGPELIDTEMLAPIKPRRGMKEKQVNGFYELRHESKGWRIACYHDLNINTFILFNGWRKTRKLQKAPIDVAYNLLYEYLYRKELSNV